MGFRAGDPRGSGQWPSRRGQRAIICAIYTHVHAYVAMNCLRARGLSFFIARLNTIARNPSKVDEACIFWGYLPSGENGNLKRFGYRPPPASHVRAAQESRSSTIRLPSAYRGCRPGQRR
jgi:hypothetical protein